jgi:RNA-binding protein
MSLTASQLKTLRRLGHDRKAVVIVGAGGASDPVLAEIDQALTRHELLKVRVRAGKRADREALVARICERTGADLVQRVGHVALLYRAHPEMPRIRLDEPAD